MHMCPHVGQLHKFDISIISYNDTFSQLHYSCPSNLGTGMISVQVCFIQDINILQIITICFICLGWQHLTF